MGSCTACGLRHVVPWPEYGPTRSDGTSHHPIVARTYGQLHAGTLPGGNVLGEPFWPRLAW